MIGDIIVGVLVALASVLLSVFLYFCFDNFVRDRIREKTFPILMDLGNIKSRLDALEKGSEDGYITVMVDIPKETYESCRREFENLKSGEAIDPYVYSIANGIPVSKVPRDSQNKQSL